MLTRAVCVIACTCLFVVIVSGRRVQPPSPITLIESNANSAVTADSTDSLRMPDNPDLTCVALKNSGYVSSACPNVDWNTYAWIQKQASDLRVTAHTTQHNA